jgi:hypothetical protein
MRQRFAGVHRTTKLLREGFAIAAKRAASVERSSRFLAATA